MFQLLKKNKLQENKLYNKILSLSRNKLFYTKLGLSDTFQNRIILIFLHISFLFVKLKKGHKIQHYKEFYQRMFNIVRPPPLNKTARFAVMHHLRWEMKKMELDFHLHQYSP